MNSDRRTNAPSRLLILWIVGFLVIGLVASYTFFNLVREIVKTWNTTALAAPSAPAPAINPQTGQPQPMVIADWQGVERVNILLLGIDEREQESGPWRTDTMMLATVDPISKTAGLLSIPRDLWVAIPGFETESKINTAHFIGDLQNYPGGGPALAMATVQYNLGITTQYYARLNFSGFEKLIDQIGGVEICVAETIDDPEYPDSGYGFEPLHIDAGCQQMDGRLALKFARTRHTGLGDFDRARRQQQVLLAVRDKVVSANMLPTLVTQAGPLLDTLKESVQTNLSLDQLIQLAKLATQIEPKNIRQAVIDENMTVGYMAPTDPPQAVLVPLREKIREMRERLLNVGPVSATIESGTGEAARLRIENGTLTNGLAAQTAQHLAALGYTVVEYTSADRFDYLESSIIDYTPNLTAAIQLAETLGLPITTVVTSTATVSGFDIRVILGSDFNLPANTTQTP
ncbi:MAG: LCP family protein [Chloroflexi bacterium]|nr:LCP family protein [Chloroflexota bacterium]